MTVKTINEKGTIQQSHNLVWVEGQTASPIVSRQIKAALVSQTPVFFQLEEGARRLTPFEFAEKISRQLANRLRGITADQLGQIRFVYQPRWTTHLSRQGERIMFRRIRDILTDLFGQTILPVQISVGNVVNA